jgi:hypothetical protein
MGVGLLVYTQEQKVSRLYERKSPQHFGHLHTRNCTSEIQLANVILQIPLKHEFKVEFNTWITSIIKEQVDNGQEPYVDFKMSNFKPRMCS